MTPERWKQVREVLDAALERAPDGRAAFLAEACAGDSSLRREVETLIASYEEETSFLENPALEPATKLLTDAGEASAVGRLIGPYKITREIGRGGMGAVYLAVRADDQYRKQVAIKLIRRGMDTEDILSRFRHERQILASLDHPNIARLLDGGTTETGLPYFVMEHIEGQPVDEYCDARRLSVRERLELFRTVCSAVSYAHQNLVVHRDLKPANILVTGEGVPKLLDFGIAKLLNPALYAQTIAQTATAVRPMTPEYASPEQVRGQPITTATDVYALGILLYELLTGRRPYRFRNALAHEIERVVCEQEPERPSTAVGRTEEVSGAGGAARVTLTPEAVSRTREGHPDKLRRRLAGDLDNIVLKALRKEPQRRYSSVGQFSEDIRRHLEGLPVIARKDTLQYRASKFVRRHKVGVGFAAAFTVLLISFAVVAFVQSARTARERDKAERVSAFLVDLFNVSDPSEARGNTITAREILDKGAERVERELGDQPEVQATLLNTIGKVYYTLGLFDKSIPLLEKSLRIRREILGNENLEVAQSLYDLSYALIEKAKLAEAEPLLREALAIRRKLLGEEHTAVADATNLLGVVMYDIGDVAASESLYRETLAVRRRLLGGEHEDVAQTLNNLALLLHDKGDYDAAEPMLQEVVAICRKLYGGDHPRLTVYINNYALLKHSTGDYDAAEALYRESLAMRRRVLGDEHPSVALNLNNLAETLREKGNYAEAEPLYREALALNRKQLGDENTLAAALTHNLAKVLYQRGDYAQSEPLFRQALATFRKLFNDSHPRAARCRANLALLLYDRGDARAAEQMFRQALEAQRKAYPKGHRDVALTLVGLGSLLAEQGRAAEAEPLLREALDTRQRILPEGHWHIAEAESALGGCLAALGRFDEAEPLLVESHSTLKARRSDGDRYARQAQERLVNLYKAWGKPDKAAEYRAGSARR